LLKLSFSAGDVIRVIDRPHSDWWQGTRDGHIGVFPSNYAKNVAETGELFTVLFQLESTSDGDLSGKVDDAVEVLEKPAGGWWLAKSVSTGDVGLLPANYIRVSSMAAALQEATSAEGVTNPTVSSAVFEDAVVIKSTQAFDALLAEGIVVEPADLKPVSAMGEAVTQGKPVSVECVAMSWVASDGGKREVFCSTRDQGRPLSFVVDHNASVTKGLALGLQGLRVGQAVFITCDPSMGYGEAGMPPLVKPNSFLVYHVEVRPFICLLSLVRSFFQ